MVSRDSNGSNVVYIENYDTQKKLESMTNQIQNMKKAIEILIIKQAGLITHNEMVSLFKMLNSIDEENRYMAEKIITAHLNSTFNENTK